MIATARLCLTRMFETLSDKLQAVLSDVRSRGKLNEDDVNKAMREIRLALLEADVNFKVVKEFTATLKERASGREVLESLNPGQQVVKIVNEELTTLMGESSREVTFVAEAADGDPDGRAAGIGQDDGLRQARPAAARRSSGKEVALGGVRRLPACGRRAARQGRRSRPARPSTSRAPSATRARSPRGRSTRRSVTARTC